MEVGTHAVVYMWRSEVNIWELIFLLPCVPGIKLRSSRLGHMSHLLSHLKGPRHTRKPSTPNTNPMETH